MFGRLDAFVKGNIVAGLLGSLLGVRPVIGPRRAIEIALDQAQALAPKIAKAIGERSTSGC